MTSPCTLRITVKTRVPPFLTSLYTGCLCVCVCARVQGDERKENVTHQPTKDRVLSAKSSSCWTDLLRARNRLDGNEKLTSSPNCDLGTKYFGSGSSRAPPPTRPPALAPGVVVGGVGVAGAEVGAARVVEKDLNDEGQMAPVERYAAARTTVVAIMVDVRCMTRVCCKRVFACRVVGVSRGISAFQVHSSFRASFHDTPPELDRPPARCSRMLFRLDQFLQRSRNSE